ncbi:hypothetical protein [Enterovibrio norvegicus]|uniref:hypothetical protein n=1 Tax=Enterovibrio norvegicus TaxID=188144 RepID=UPI0002D7E01B|nr:hypothetical protein [Enterovibrio norvegicus]OEF58597.1 hypothetical protein A1OU_10560 [Enterovibrio norvegicus]
MINSNRHEFGEFMAPILKSFCKWLCEELVNRNISHVYFMSREGAFLKLVFDEYLKTNTYNFKISTYHLEVSRRSLSVPSINCINDIKRLVFERPTRFYTLSELLKFRFGVDVYSQKDIDLKYLSKKECFNHVEKYAEEILDNAARERLGLGRYLHKMLPDSKDQISLVDIGYNGTLQSILNNSIVDNKVTGFYFSTFSGITSKLQANEFKSFYLDCYDNQSNSCFFSKNIALFEYFLTLGDASVSRYSEQGCPIYMDASEGNSDYKITFQSCVIDSIASCNEFVGDNGLMFDGLNHSIINEMIFGLKGAYIEDLFGGKKRRYIIFESRNPTSVFMNSEWSYGAYEKIKSQHGTNFADIYFYLSGLPERIFFFIRKFRRKVYAYIGER